MRINMEKLIPVQEVPKILPVKMGTVRAWIFQERLPVVRLGRKVFVKEAILRRISEDGLEAVAGEAGRVA